MKEIIIVGGRRSGKTIKRAIEMQQYLTKRWKYCPYCGNKLSHKVETDENSEMICKTSRTICNRP